MLGKNYKTFCPHAVLQRRANGSGQKLQYLSPMTRSLRQSPLRDREEDAQLFVAPEGFSRLQSAVQEGANVLLLAERGGGKTTALRLLQWRLRQGGAQPPTVFVDLAGARTPGIALQTIVAEASEHLGVPVSWRPPRPYEADDDFNARSAIDHLGELSKCRFLIDNANADQVAYAIFGTFRDRMWETPHQWVLAADLSDQDRVTRPPADAFWDELVTLAFTAEQAAKLIALRLEERPAWLPPMVDEAGTNPRQLVRAAFEAKRHPRQPAAAIAARRAWNARVEGLAERPARLLSELQSIGPVSASDGELRARLGWARTTIQRALAELVDAGLVRSWEQPEGQGRPRRLFVAIDPGTELNDR
jgi:hypothetical protein